MNRCAKFHKDSPITSGRKLNSISWAWLNFRRLPILCTALYETSSKRATSVAHLTNFSFELFMKFSQKMPLNVFYTIVQKSQKWPKAQIKGEKVLPKELHWVKPQKIQVKLGKSLIIGSSEALPCLYWGWGALCVCVCERGRERQRETDGSDAILVALKLAMSSALFLAKILHLSFSPFESHWLHTFHCQKRCNLRNSSHSSFCFCQMAWQGIEVLKQMIEFLAAPSFFSSRKWITLIPITIGNRERDCVWGCARRINTTRENLQIKKHKSRGRSFRSPDWVVRSADFLRWCLSPECNLTHNLFFCFQ